MVIPDSYDIHAMNTDLSLEIYYDIDYIYMYIGLSLAIYYDIHDIYIGSNLAFGYDIKDKHRFKSSKRSGS